MACALLAFACCCSSPGLAMAHGERSDVIEGVTQEIAAAPRNPSLYFHRAEMYRLDKQWKEAESDYARVEALDPSLHSVQLGRAKLRLAQGDPAGALQLLDTFLVADSSHPEGRLLRAAILEDRGDWQRADADLAVAVASSPEPHYATLRAQLLQRHGRSEDAVRCLDEASTRKGHSVPVLEQQALDIEEQAGRTDAALARLDRFIAREPRPDLWLLRKANLLEKAGRTGEAKIARQQASVAFGKLPAERQAMEINRKLVVERPKPTANARENTP